MICMSRKKRDITCSPLCMDVRVHKVTVQWKQVSVSGNDGQERSEEKAKVRCTDGSRVE